MALIPPNTARGGYPLGLAGATSATRFVGAVASGVPLTGAFLVGDFVVGQDGTLSVCTVAGSPGTWVTVGAGGGLFSSYALVRDEKAQGTAGGTITANTWTKRVLNTESFDPDGIVSLASDQFTLQAGTYFLKGRGPAYSCEAHKLRIYNATDAAVAIVGDSCYSTDGAGVPDRPAEVVGRVTIASAKAFELQHLSRATQNTDGMGTQTDTAGTVEVYGSVEIWLEA